MLFITLAKDKAMIDIGKLGVWYGADKLTPGEWTRFIVRCGVVPAF